MRDLLKKVLLPILLVVFAFGYAQETTYNLPPGYRLKKDFTLHNLSYKLDNSKSVKSYPEKDLIILKQIKGNELQNTSVEYQNYIKVGKEYMAKLSKKVKSIYSETELWYIFAFDSELKEKLLFVK